MPVVQFRSDEPMVRYRVECYSRYFRRWMLLRDFPDAEQAKRWLEKIAPAYRGVVRVITRGDALVERRDHGRSTATR